MGEKVHTDTKFLSGSQVVNSPFLIKISALNLKEKKIKCGNELDSMQET